MNKLLYEVFVFNTFINEILLVLVTICSFSLLCCGILFCVRWWTL